MASTDFITASFESCSASGLQVLMNNFLATTNLAFSKVTRSEMTIWNGNTMFVGTIAYKIDAGTANTRLVKIIEKENITELRAAVNTFLQTTNINVTALLRDEICLETGNKIYMATIVYRITTLSSYQIEIIEKDNIIDWQIAVNAYIVSNSRLLHSSGIQTNTLELANGNKSYIATIPYTPNT